MWTHLLARDELTERGVFLARTLSERGHPWYYAVTSDHRSVRSVDVTGLVTPDVAQRILWAHLDEVDPQAALKLVKDAPSAPVLEPPVPLGKASPGLAIALLGMVRPRTPLRGA